MSMVKKGVSARGGIALSHVGNEVSKCPSCGKYLTSKNAGSRCPHCGYSSKNIKVGD